MASVRGGLQNLFELVRKLGFEGGPAGLVWGGLVRRQGNRLLEYSGNIGPSYGRRETISPCRTFEPRWCKLRHNEIQRRRSRAQIAERFGVNPGTVQRISRPFAGSRNIDRVLPSKNDRSRRPSAPALRKGGTARTFNVNPWGRWATLVLGLIAMLLGQLAALTALIWWSGLGLTQVPDVTSDGVALILIVCISTPIQVFVLALMARQTGASATNYLGLKLPRRIEVVGGIIIIVIFVAVSDGITWLLGRDIVSQFQLDIYASARNAGYLPSLWLTLVVIAPIGEETLFRGFLFRGWYRVPRDVWPVIIVTSSIWALSHVQYDLFFMAQVFVSGLLLGWFRWISGSTILTMLLHGLLNCEGTLETLMAFQH
jgi:uncharacterized protein